MAQPVDRAEGVVLVTDYGALDRALEQMARREAKSQEDGERIAKIREAEMKMKESSQTADQ